MRCGKSSRPDPGDGPHLRDRLDAGRQHRGRCGGDRPGFHRARSGRDRCLLRPDQQGREAGVRSVLPDPVRRQDPSAGGCPGRGHGDRGRCHLVVRRCELDPAGRSRGSVCDGPPAPLQPAMDLASGRRAGLSSAPAPIGRTRSPPAGASRRARGPTRSRPGSRCCGRARSATSTSGGGPRWVRTPHALFWSASSVRSRDGWVIGFRSRERSN